jgi:uncharacterized protein YecE (DUF72 family)
MARIKIGVSSWAEEGLVKSGFYPPDVKTPAGRLRYYSGRFPVAEIDSSFHFFPTRRIMALWLENTPPGFTFDPKAFSLFTLHPTPLMSLPRSIRERYGPDIKAKGNVYLHHLPAPAIDELWQVFDARMKELADAGKLGCVVFQFPPYFHPSPENYEHIRACKKRLGRRPMAVEFRAPSWVSGDRLPETLKTLRGLAITLACVDEPQGLKTSMPPLGEVTAPLAFVRFHGRNVGNWEEPGVSPQSRHEYEYTEAELKQCVPKIRAMAALSDELHVIFMNKLGDASVRNAGMMKGLLGV